MTHVLCSAVILLSLNWLLNNRSDGSEPRSNRSDSKASEIERREMINQLTNIIRDPENHADQRTAVRQAIDRLGDLREVEAIDVLVDYISFPWVSYHGHRQRFLGKGRLTAPRPDGTPAVDALVAIGEPCIPKVISKLAETESVFEQNSCIAVLRRIDAQESVLEQLTEALKNATERQRPSLERALQEVVVHEDVR